MPAPPLLGLDFDHTLVSYEAALADVAEAQGFDRAIGKTALRDALRAGLEGDLAWQRVQAQLYGPGMERAQWMEGADVFLRTCRDRGIEVHIVSHKTECAPCDPSRFPLRKAALAWLEARGCFGPLGIAREHVHFGATRAEKLACIRALGCRAFVDDLVEVFREPAFPERTEKILLRREGGSEAGLTVCRTWAEVAGHVLGE